jgi:protein tyrosine phosphatase (PTP) superfamily phosphohydrolase (DUF442 family)
MKDSAPQRTDIYKILRIHDLLTTSGQPTEDQLRGLAQDGCQVIINLALHNDPRYSLPNERGYVEELGLVYVHIPVQFAAPTEEHFLDFISAMELHKNKKLHVHCAANMRVTAFIGVYRAVKQECSLEVAFEPMRSIWEPNEVWSSFIASMLAKHNVR